MAAGAVRHWSCTDWQRGMDCAFDEWLFKLITSIIWALTSLVFLGLTFAPLRSQRPTGPARCCLLLTVMSAVLHSLDAALYLALESPGRKAAVYGAQLFASFGSICLVVAFRVFAHAWCDVASALCKLGSSGPHPSWSPARWFGVIRCTYTVVMVVHVPVALVFSISDYPWAPDYDTVALVYIVWLAISLVGLLSVMAVAMLHIARKHTCDGKAERSFRRVTLINLIEQVLFDFCWILSGAMYLSGSYNEHGKVQAFVYALNFLLTWFMHIQILFFFTICDVDDPLYSAEQYSQLLSGGRPDERSPDASAIGLASLGPPARQPGLGHEGVPIEYAD